MITLAFWLFACTPTDPGPAHDTDSGKPPHQVTLPPAEEPTEAVPDAPPGGDDGGGDDGGTDDSGKDTGIEKPEVTVFDDTQVREFVLTIPTDSWQKLTMGGGWGGGNEYVEATLKAIDQELLVGIRLKGSSTFQPLPQKPNFKVKIDAFVVDQELEDVDSFDMLNEMYDPSYMKEFLTYKTFREAGLPASRTGWVHLTVNETDYGLYGLVEQEDKRYLKQWFEDTTGSVYESVGCDVTSNINCWELDRDGAKDDGFSYDKLHDAALVSGADWFPSIQTVMDWPVVSRSIALEQAMAHWDGYSGNLNNIRIYHEPTLDLWYYTPWSTDLAFGSYPWSGILPYCAQYFTSPSEYTRGVLTENCRADADCSADFKNALLEMADHIEKIDLVAEMERVEPIIHDFAVADPKNNFGEHGFDEEVTCMKEWIAQRPEELRDMVP